MVILWVPGIFALSLISGILIVSSRCRDTSCGLVSLQNDSVHTVNWPSILVLAGEEFLTANGTCHDIAHQRVALWQVCSEVHLLPTSEE